MWSALEADCAVTWTAVSDRPPARVPEVHEWPVDFHTWCSHNVKRDAHKSLICLAEGRSSGSSILSNSTSHSHSNRCFSGPGRKGGRFPGLSQTASVRRDLTTEIFGRFAGRNSAASLAPMWAFSANFSRDGFDRPTSAATRETSRKPGSVLPERTRGWGEIRDSSSWSASTPPRKPPRPKRLGSKAQTFGVKGGFADHAGGLPGHQDFVPFDRMGTGNMGRGEKLAD